MHTYYNVVDCQSWVRRRVVRHGGGVPVRRDEAGSFYTVWSRRPVLARFLARLVAGSATREDAELCVAALSSLGRFCSVADTPDIHTRAGRPIPEHSTRPDLQAPAASWTPVISPADLVFYQGDLFADWRGDALIAGLSAEGIVRVRIDGEQAVEVARYPLNARIRGLAEAADGSLWVLEDERRGSPGRLLKLKPRE